MRSFSLAVTLLSLLILQSFSVFPAIAETNDALLEQAMSETLDLWREGRFELLYEHLSHRGKMSKERFTQKMEESAVRPACCYRKMEGFKVLSERHNEATIYVKIGLEGTASPAESVTREFRLTRDGGTWQMQLSDITALGGLTAKKQKIRHKKKHYI